MPQRKTPSLDAYQKKFVNQVPAGFFGARVDDDFAYASVYRILGNRVFRFDITHGHGKSQYSPNGIVNDTFVDIYQLNKDGRIEVDEFGKAIPGPRVIMFNFQLDSQNFSRFPQFSKEEVGLLLRCAEELSVSIYHAFRDG